MKKLINKLNRKANSAVISVKSAIESKTGEGYIDTGIKIIIGVVIGGLILTALTTLFSGTILNGMQTKITNMFA